MNIRKFDQLLYKIISSRRFFYATLVIFGLSAAWVATASLYPMAFDEDFHIGIIKIYAHHLLPILASSPDMAKYGGVSADPSYLFHYLMSFPWRLEQNVFHMSETASIIGLRLLDVVLFVAGLIVFWWALAAMRLSAFARNIIIAFCCLIPISPVLAGQVNYDNLLILEVATSFYLAVTILRVLRDKQRLPATLVWLLPSVLLVGSATKYPFLPIGAAIAGTILGAVFIPRQRSKVFGRFLRDTAAIRPSVKLLLTVLLVIGFMLNVRYVTNLAAYHDITPRCDTFFTVQSCMAYGPYGRDINLHANLSPAFQPENIAVYFVKDWIPGMVLRLFFAVAGPTNNFATRLPVLVPIVIYCAGAVLAVCLFAVRSVRIVRGNPAAWLSLAIVGVYCFSLLYSVYESYASTGEPVAVNGRYLLPLAPIIGALIAMAFQSGRLKAAKAKAKVRYGSVTVTALALLLVLVQGGGVATYIVRGEPEWFWPGWGQTSYKAIHGTLDPVTLQY